MTKRRKRSSRSGRTPADQDLAAGVGGRHPDPATDPRGGGYPDVCTEPAFGAAAGAARDPRLAELRRIGIRRTWVRIAEDVGFDHFMRIWRRLAEDPQVKDERGRVYVPSITQFFRYQRNRLILSLAEEGKEAHEIHRVVADQLCEEVSEKHIQRIVSQGNN